jgi:hypothetical protein
MGINLSFSRRKKPDPDQHPVSKVAQQAICQTTEAFIVTVQRRPVASRRASICIDLSCFLLHCNRHTTNGSRNFSTDPCTTKL